MGANRISSQEQAEKPESASPPPEPSLGLSYRDAHKRIQYYWSEVRTCQEALGLYGPESAKSQFDTEFLKVDDQFEERGNTFRALLRHTLRDVREGVIGIVRDTTTESLLISLHGELLEKDIPNKETIIADVRQKIEEYEKETKMQLELLMSAHALPIVRALVHRRADILSRKKDDAVKIRMHSAEYKNESKILGLKFVQTLYEVLVKKDSSTVATVNRLVHHVADAIKTITGGALTIAPRTIHRWAQGGPLLAQPRFDQLITLLRQKLVDENDIARIQEAYSNYRALKCVKEPEEE
jgi:hypothetical protein